MSKADHRRWQGWGEYALERPVVERCAYCDFVASGTVKQARQAFAEHVCDRPRPTTTVRRRSGFRLR